MTPPAAPVPTRLALRKGSRCLDLHYADGRVESLDWEYLRVCSPSAEVQGHGGEPRTVPGKRNVAIKRVEAVGNYAVRLVFDDGHDSGIYSWDVLDELIRHREANWARYLAGLELYRMSRDSDVLSFNALTAGKRPPRDS
jgi:DUF971 family protein